MPAPDPALLPSTFLDADHPAVQSWARQHAGAGDDRARAIRLYYAVRDGFRYDPYRIDLSPDGLKASRVLADGFGWCVPKAVLLAAACRASGIPARVGLADVRNHLSTERLRQTMGTDIFYCHGYTAIALDGRWVKATPAFNVELCHKLGLHTLEFDGREDSIYHPFDTTGRRHMEYVALRGEFDELPRQMLLDVFAQHYPGMGRLSDASWEDDLTGDRLKASADTPRSA
jgi:transglutaminase-like putative cysteine protease